MVQFLYYTPEETPVLKDLHNLSRIYSILLPSACVFCPFQYVRLSAL